MKLKIMLLGMVLLLGLIALPTVMAAAPSANVTIDITVASVAAIQVNDTDVSFGNVAPMANGSLFGIKVTNVGSTDVNNVYAHVNTMNKGTTNPRGTSTSTNWIATSFLSLNNVTSGSDYYYPGNLVWNMSANYDTTGWTLTSGVAAFGDFWEGGSSTSDLYYWEMKNGTDPVANASPKCNLTTTVIKMQATKASKSTSTGTSLTAGTAAADWASFTVASGPWANYCVYAYYDCTKLYVSRWDFNSTLPTCTTRQYIHATTMAPNDDYTFRIIAIVPPAVATGATTQGTLRIYGNSA